MSAYPAVTCLVDARAELGEGALWDAVTRRLYWVDITGQRLFATDPETSENRSWSLGQMVSTVVPHAAGGLLLALRDGIASFDPANGTHTQPRRPDDYDPRTHRFNDGKCDPQGRFWVGSMGLTRPRAPGTLYRLDPDGRFHAMLRDVGTSNGIVWDAEIARMYFIDTPLRRVDAFDFDPDSGAIANRRTVITIPPEDGNPDGSTLDAEGMLWIAHWGGSRVSRWNPRTGEALATIPVPAQRVTSCAFGGPGLDHLFITTARPDADDDQRQDQPQAGGLFVVRPGVSGVPASSFRPLATG